jgi:hypothetical protein
LNAREMLGINDNFSIKGKMRRLVLTSYDKIMLKIMAVIESYLNLSEQLLFPG